MRKFITIALLSLVLAGAAFAKDHSSDYQMGTLVRAGKVDTGMWRDTTSCGTTVCSGGISEITENHYYIKVADGTWVLYPNWGDESKHNPLLLMKPGDNILFRIEQKRKLNGTFPYAYIPRADDPDKEIMLAAKFVPDIAPSVVEKPSDNVKAMCDAHKLSPELEKQLCVVPTPSTSTETPTIAPSAPPVTEAPIVAPAASPPAKTEVVVPTGVLTNQSIVDMVKAGLSDDAIIARIQASKTHFDVSTAATAKLMQDAPGISMGVIKAMVLSWMKR